MKEKEMPELTKNKMLDEAIQKLISDANDTTDPKQRKQSLELVEKLYCVDTEHAKVSLEEKRLELDKKRLTQDDVIKLIQIFGVPFMGFLLLVGYRILMETETAPDIFFRDIGKTTMGLMGFKKV